MDVGIVVSEQLLHCRSVLLHHRIARGALRAQHVVCGSAAGLCQSDDTDEECQPDADTDLLHGCRSFRFGDVVADYMANASVVRQYSDRPRIATQTCRPQTKRRRPACAWRIANFLSILEFAMHT